MLLNANDISLVFLGILIVMVLLEVRKLGRKSPPVARLEERFDRLSQETGGIRPEHIELPGGAEIVETHRSFAILSHQLDRLGRSVRELDGTGGPGGPGDAVASSGRFEDRMTALRAELAVARELFEAAAVGLGQASNSMMSAGSALQRIDSTLERVPVPAGDPEAARSGSEGPEDADDSGDGRPPAPPATEPA